MSADEAVVTRQGVQTPVSVAAHALKDMPDLSSATSFQLLQLLHKEGWKADHGRSGGPPYVGGGEKVFYVRKKATTVNTSYLHALLRADELTALTAPVHHGQINAYYQALLHFLDSGGPASGLDLQQLQPGQPAKFYKAFIAGTSLEALQAARVETITDHSGSDFVMHLEDDVGIGFDGQPCPEEEMPQQAERKKRNVRSTVAHSLALLDGFSSEAQDVAVEVDSASPDQDAGLDKDQSDQNDSVQQKRKKKKKKEKKHKKHKRGKRRRAAADEGSVHTTAMKRRLPSPPAVVSEPSQPSGLNRGSAGIGSGSTAPAAAPPAVVSEPSQPSRQNRGGTGSGSIAPAGTLSSMFDETTVWLGVPSIPIVKRKAPAGYYITCPLHKCKVDGGGHRACKKEIALSGRADDVVVRALAWWMLQGHLQENWTFEPFSFPTG